MSESTVETVEQENSPAEAQNSEQAETSEATEEKPKPALDELGQMLFGRLSAQRSEFVNAWTKVQAATGGDRAKILAERVESSTDPEVVSLREQIESLRKQTFDLQEQAEAKVSAEIDSEKMSDEEKSSLEETMTTLRGKIDNGLKYLESMVPGFQEAYWEPLPGQRRRRSSSGATKPGDGTRRPRIDGFYVSEDLSLAASDSGWELVSETKTNNKGEEVTRSTFTQGARKLSDMLGRKVEITELHSAYSSEAGTTDVSSIKTAQTFTVSNGEKRVNVLVTPKVDEPAAA